MSIVFILAERLQTNLLGKIYVFFNVLNSAVDQD